MLIESVLSLSKASFAKKLSEAHEPLNLVDTEGYSVLHEFSICMVHEEVLLEFFELLKAILCKRSAAEWKNLLELKTLPMKRTALHMAVMNGRRKLALKLLDEGVDTKSTDSLGQGLAHMSAQTHDAFFIIYCNTVLQADLSALDARGRTPLHLAALEGKDAPIGPLLALTKDVNARDNEGMTPLHYAVMSENTSIIKQLLMQGADRQAVDKRGKRPFHLAQIKKLPRVGVMLKDQHFWSEFNPVSHPLKPVKHRFLLFGFYHCIMFLWYCSVVIFILPNLYSWFSVISIVLLMLSFFMFEAVARLDPGYRNDSDKDMLRLYSKYSYNHVCPYCRAKKGHRDVHCVYCNRCVKNFDHHCPWINNCVGGGNQRFFVAFLIVKQVAYIYHVIIGLLDFLGFIPHSSPLYGDPLHSYSNIGNGIGLAISILCLICSLAMAPCLYVQIQNLRDTGRVVPTSSLVADDQSDTHSMLVQPSLSEDLLFHSRSSAPSESLIRMTVEEVYRKSGCLGLCRDKEFNYKFEQDSDARTYSLVLKL